MHERKEFCQCPQVPTGVPLLMTALQSVQQLERLERWVKAINTRRRRSTRKVGPAASVQHNRPLLSTEENTVPKKRGGKKPPLAAKHLGETELGPENLGVTPTLLRGFTVHSRSHILLFRTL